MDAILETLIEKSAEKLFFYSPYNFIRKIPLETHLEKVLRERIYSPKSLTKIFEFSGKNYAFVTEFLAWDTEFFKAKMHKLKFVIYDDKQFLNQAVEAYKDYLKNELEAEYCFIEVPSEDTEVLQALTRQGFGLIETRLTYFHQQLKKYEYRRFQVRHAELADTPNLERVASEMRNIYDRIHADSFFSEEIADRFLSRYVAEAIKGFSDVVLVPNQEGVPSDGFLTANYLKDEWDKLDINVSKMVLSAVSTSCRGWYVKLISEMTYLLREEGAECIFMNTQSTNRAVFRTWEKLGYQLGMTTHILAISNL